MEFATPYNRIYVDPPNVEGEEIVEKAGYRPIEKQVNELIMAGETLRQYRLGYEFGKEEEIDPEYTGDITRRSDFDLVDVQHLDQALMSKAQTKLSEKQKKTLKLSVKTISSKQNCFLRRKKKESQNLKKLQ